MEYLSKLVLPKLTTSERDAVSLWVSGSLIYNTTLAVTQQYNGSAWSSFSLSALPYKQFQQDNTSRTTASTAATYVNITSVTFTGLTIGVNYVLSFSVELANGNAGQKTYCRVFLAATQVFEGSAYPNIVNQFQAQSGLATFTATATTQVVQLTGRVSGNTGTYRNYRVFCNEI